MTLINNGGHDFVKAFEDRVLEFDISIRGRRKYNSLYEFISIDWFYSPKTVKVNMFDNTVASLFENGKINKYQYIILKAKNIPVNIEMFWIDALNLDDGT